MSQSAAKKKELQAAVKAPVGPSRLARKRAITPRGIVLLSLFGILLAAAVFASVYALTYDRVYPGLSAYGIDFGGMTREEAEDALTQKMDAVYAGTSVTLSLDGQSVTITAEDAGVSLSADEAAEAVYRAGRTGSVFSRLAFAFSSLYARRTVEDAVGFYIDREAVRGIVSSLSDSLFQPPVEYMWVIGKSVIDVTCGRDGAVSDPDGMTEAVIGRFAGKDFSPLSYRSETVPPAPLPLQDLYDQIKVEPEDAYIVLDEDEQASVIPHVVGVSFDMRKANDLLAQRPEKMSIPLLFTVPDLTAAALEENLFRDMLGQYSTSTAGSSQNRVTNIDLTAQFMTGTVIMPGGECSFNKTVGKRTEARGFKMAGAYNNGQVVDEIGGGICQASTTLYNAVMRSNLHIISRQGHSMTVGYVPLGMDATVDWDNIDFVFSNDTAYPIRIVAWYASQRLNIQIWGTKTDDLTVSIENEVLAHKPSQTLTEHNPALAPGAKSTKTTGHDGWTVQTYRVLKDPDGKVVYRNPEAKTQYKKVDTIIEVGVPAGGDLPDENGGVETMVPVIPSPDPSPDPMPDPYPEPVPDPGPDPTSDPDSQSPVWPEINMEQEDGYAV